MTPPKKLPYLAGATVLDAIALLNRANETLRALVNDNRVEIATLRAAARALDCNQQALEKLKNLPKE